MDELSGQEIIKERKTNLQSKYDLERD